MIMLTVVKTGPSFAPRVAQVISSCLVRYYKVLLQELRKSFPNSNVGLARSDQSTIKVKSENVFDCGMTVFKHDGLNNLDDMIGTPKVC